MNGGCALLMDARSRRIVHAEGDPELVTAPGSVLKPLVLAALLDSRKLRADEQFVCPIELRIGGRNFTCIHPRMAAPITAATALAYSCNNFVAHVAKRLEPGELPRYLAHAGLSPSRIRPAQSEEARQLQALGNGDIAVTPRDLLFAYHLLAFRPLDAILEGLEGAVAFGTGQNAQVRSVSVAGKTGTASGNAAWFAGFAPSRGPKVIAVVLTGGRSGGADAAPIASRLIAEYLR